MTIVDKENTTKEYLEKAQKRMFKAEPSCGDEYFGQKYDKVTLSYYDKAIELSNDNNLKAEALCWKGEQWENMAEKIGETVSEEAIKCYDESLILNPNNAKVWNRKGVAMKNNNQIKEALKCFERAVKLESNNDVYKCYYAEGLFSMGQNEDAIKILLETQYDLLEKLYRIDDKDLNYDILVNSNKFTDDYFCMLTKDIIDAEKIKLYREIYLLTLLIIKQLYIKGVDVAHYTSRSVVQKMIFGDEPLIRLNMAVESNDSKEGTTLFEYLGTRDGVYFYNHPKYGPNELMENNYRAFVCCFSLNADNLNQFRLYGRENNNEGTGVSIEFNAFPFFKNQPVAPYSKSIDSLSLFRCLYLDNDNGLISIGHNESEKSEDINDKKNNIKKYLTELKKKVSQTDINEPIIRQLLINLQYLTKDAGFKEEQECRILRLLPFTDHNVFVSEEFNNMFVKYPISLKDHNINKIIFGPKAAGLSLFKDILNKKGINIHCEQSKLPLA
jgi:tetratricopeptide (TPR) repeat protein